MGTGGVGRRRALAGAILATGLTVPAGNFTTLPTGFKITFSKPLTTSLLELYGSGTAAANAPSLTLVKTVTNDNGGTAVATDFTLSVRPS